MAGALGVKATPFTYAAHVLAAAAAVMVLVWCIHFRGGLAFEAVNKNLIFNVSPPPLFPLIFPLHLATAPYVRFGCKSHHRGSFVSKENYWTIVYVRYYGLCRPRVVGNNA
jgi:hypothetical protein